jgi:PP-loop superfamily ATP-utilizing enzyme
MTGVAVTPEKLRHVEEMESILHAHGINVARVRVHEGGPCSFLRIEVGPHEMEAALAARAELLAAGVSRGYGWVLLDLAGYRTGGAVVR